LVPDRWFGAGNSSAETQDGGAKISVKDGDVHKLTLHYVAQPDGGSASLSTEHGEVGSIATNAAAKTAMSKSFVVADGFANLTLATTGKVRVFGVELENETGAVVDNLGVVSVNAKNFAFNQPAHFASQLADRGADLVVVMIGANEAQWLGPGDQDTKEYQARYAAMLAPIKTITPNASCLVVSPTDQAYVVGDGYASRPVMPYIIDAQRNAAKAAGCAFFSTYNWMGAKGSAAQWLKKGYIGSDFQHLSRKGATKLADALFRALITPTRVR
jgi:lysophospholipase L1-like esterase